MKSILILVTMLLVAAASHANDGKIMGPVLALGTYLYDHDNNGGTADIEVGQVLLDESHADWNADMDGDNSTYGHDCAGLLTSATTIDLSTDGGRAMYSVLMSAQTEGLLAIIDYDEDANDNCVVKTVLTIPVGVL